MPTNLGSTSAQPAADGLGPVPADNRPGHRPPWPQDKPAPGRRPRRPRATTTPAAAGAVRHPFLFDPVMLPAALAVGATPWTTWVDVGDERLHIRFGPWSLACPLDNVVAAEVTGPYRLHKVIGPPHLSFSDGGVTFATNRAQGTCIQFDEPVAGLVPSGLLRHPGATVTVADPHALAEALDPRHRG
jgi:hypothetical protein